LPEGDPARRELSARERELLDAHRAEWEAPLAGLATGCVFRRGFVEEVKVEAKHFLRCAPEIFAASPVRHVYLLDVSDGLPGVFQSPYLSRLSALSVKDQHTGEPLARAVARSEHLAGLKRLYLTKNRLGDGAAEQLALSPHLTNLEVLDLGGNEIGEAGTRALAASPHLARLRRLELGGNRIGPAGAEAIACSERLGALRALGLASNEVGLPRLQALAGVQELLRVPVLDLAVNGLNASGLQAILARPRGAVRLEELDLTGNVALGDDGARVLAKSPQLAGLTVLRLVGCNIGDEGARALAACPHMTRVAELNLENNPIGDAGFRPWLEAGANWRSLRRILPPRLGVSGDMHWKLEQAFGHSARRG
jgi:hypothetical protein